MVFPFDQPHSEKSVKRVRVLFGQEWIVDTKKASLVWEFWAFPWYFLNPSDVPEKYLRKSEVQDVASATVFDVVTAKKVAERAAIQYGNDAPPHMAGLTKLVWAKMDAWFEEEEQIFNHPKDPYKRVDVLQSSRHIRVEIDGVEVANTHKPRLLFETGLPVRTYIPKTDCRMDLLEPSTLNTECPYKGIASYYNVRLPSGNLVENVVWWYRTTTNDCPDIRGYVAFYDEKLDVWVDGEKQERPGKLF